MDLTSQLGSSRDLPKVGGFEMILSSPEYPQGHALIERHIQTVKKCMQKCDVSGYDFDLALLVLRSTPLGPDLPSPAELLQERRFRTTLPTYVPDPRTSESVSQRLRERQVNAAAQYYKTAKVKPELVSGQPVRLWNKQTRRWEPALVSGEAGTPRSYVVQRVAGGVPLRRNRVHIRTTRENFDGPLHNGEEEDVVGQADADNEPQVTVPVTAEETLPAPVERVVRRSDRVRNQTQFYQAGQ